jgi:hypothetical protein
MTTTIAKSKRAATEYRTKDWEIASLLYASGHALAAAEWVDGVCFFAFEDETACERTIASYYRGELRLDPRVIFQAWREVKNILRRRY